MKEFRVGRVLAVGFGLLVVAVMIVLGVSGGEEEVAIEPSPMDELAVEIAEAPDLQGEPEILAHRDWDLPVTRNNRVEYWIEFLTGRNRDRTHLWLERAGHFAPVILPALRERGMPEDLIYLAMIESGFSTQAYSRARAVGLWQFIAETGRRYGLEVSTHVDERRDPVKATNAALDYLEELYDQFGSWYLAAAAYNSGEHRVERILRQRAGGQRGDDALYWRISQYLPRETRDYVPLMLAAGHIGKDPEKYGFEGLEMQDPLTFESVRVPESTSLSLVARAAGADASEVESLNPHLLRGMTPPGRDWLVRLPVGTRHVFARNFERVREEERLAGTWHTVRRGETLSHISRRYGVSVASLRDANGGVQPSRLQVGQRLRVPGSGQPTQVASASSELRYHDVQRGDTLWGIARRYNVSVNELRAWNGMRGSRILPGQRLQIGA